MIPRSLKRRFRPMWIAAVASAAWANRVDVKRWLAFGRRAVDQRKSRPLSEVLTEAKVRAAVSANPLLRRDATLQDVVVDNGVVTLITNTASWPDSRQTRRLKKVKGIADVVARTSATSQTPP
jgi:hypothetical protein